MLQFHCFEPWHGKILAGNIGYGRKVMERDQTSCHTSHIYWFSIWLYSILFRVMVSIMQLMQSKGQILLGATSLAKHFRFATNNTAAPLLSLSCNPFCVMHLYCYLEFWLITSLSSPFMASSRFHQLKNFRTLCKLCYGEENRKFKYLFVNVNFLNNRTYGIEGIEEYISLNHVF